MKDYWRPIDLARAVGVSTQTVRLYEQLGFLPPADRSVTGYRRYEAHHLRALRAARLMIAGYEWPSALRIMQSVHEGDIGTAVAAVDACHAALHHMRHDAITTLDILRSAATSSMDSNSRQSRTEPTLKISAAARRGGVRVSTVRFWEKHDLVRPRRDATSGYRLYDAAQVRRIQVTVLLRHAGYGLDAIRPVLAELDMGQPEQAVHAAERRLVELAHKSRQCSAATAAFWNYIENL